MINFPNLEMPHEPQHTGTAGVAGVKNSGKAGPALLAGRWTWCLRVSDILEAWEEAAEQVSHVTHALGPPCLEESFECVQVPSSSL